MSRKISEENVKQLIQRYLKEIKEYSELVLVLATLKKTFRDISKNKRISAGVYIEDAINYLNEQQPKIPDLIILEHYEKIGVALDHKYTKTRSKEHLRRVIRDITKYRGTALINSTEYEILDCFLIIPESYFKIIKDILDQGYEYSDIYILSPFKWHIHNIYKKLSKHFDKNALHLVYSDLPKDEKVPPRDKILLTTYVSSKGLENKVVVVTGTHLVPRHESETEPSLTSKQVERIDRRRLYVAMTRARDMLFITASKKRGFAKELCEIKDIHVIVS